MYVLGKFKSIVISLALLGISTESFAQVESGSMLLFAGISEPWQLLLNVGVFLGLLVALVPVACSLSALTSSLIGTENQDSNEGGSNKSILFLACLVGGISSYALILAGINFLKIDAAVSGEILSIVFWGAILILSALSLFGLYKIRLPKWIQVLNQSEQTRPMAQRMLIMFGIGLVPTLIGVTLLAFLVLPNAFAENSTAYLVSVSIIALLWSVAIFGLVTGVFSGISSSLLQSGDWTPPTRRLLGVLQLAAVIHLLGAFPEVPILLLWGILLMVTAVFLGATRKGPQMAKPSSRLFKGAGIAVMIWGGVTLVGASTGNRDIANPLPQLHAFISGGGLTGSAESGTAVASAFTYINSETQFEDSLSSARTAGLPVMVEFYADWCLDCKRMDRSTFKEPTVAAQLNDNFVALKIDVSDPDDQFGRDMRKRYGIFGPPARILIDGQGTYRQDLLTYGFLNTEDFLSLLSNVSDGGASQT